MNPSDLIIICALELPIEQAFDLLHWYMRTDYQTVADPAIHWWVTKNAPAVAALRKI